MKLPRKVMMKFCLGFICLALAFSGTNIFASYYTGYYYYGDAGSPPANGVRATIYTINKDVYDSNGYNIYWHGQPTGGSTYNYYINRSTGSSTWTLGVDSQFSRNITPSPYSPVDYQAFCETTTSDIDIDGTHFTSLQTKSGNDWNSWNTHLGRSDIPYTITQTSDTEFYGWW